MDFRITRVNCQHSQLGVGGGRQSGPVRWGSCHILTGFDCENNIHITLVNIGKVSFHEYCYGGSLHLFVHNAVRLEQAG